MVGTARRDTRQRRIVADALRAARGALSAQELHAALPRRERVGLATVYRTLETLVADGLATRLEREGHVSAYAACAAEHHHHLVCTRCQRVEDLDEAALRPLLARVRARHGFAVDHATLDLYGLCAGCRRRGGRA
ncbi:MAG TPA: transcriptional repressor [Candidatus Limnocylindria bacterium]|nr:transcriptional repressor [Candidatus Limnocylindria bacterium]